MKVTIVCATLALLALCAFPSVEGLTGPATKCPAGFTQSVTACRAPQTTGRPLSGTGPCCSCPFGSFNTDGLSCRRCTSGLVAQSGVDLTKTGTQCFCLPGFGDYDPVAMTCRQCPINTYSLNNKCVPCAANTFAPVQSSACAAVNCPASSYLPPGGATIGDCVKCKFGTVGQACSTVQACGCAPGYATFDKVGGACQVCPSNSIQVYADSRLADATNTVCWPCPAGTVASADGTTCAASSNIGTAATPVPANPIPSTTCSIGTLPVEPGCTNGYDMTITLIKNTLGSNPSTSTVAATTPHDGDASMYTETTKAVTIAGAVAADLIVVFTNELGLIQGSLRSDSATGTVSVFGSQNGNNVNYYGLTCAQAASSLGNSNPCIQVPSGSTPVSLKSLLPAGFLTSDSTSTSWDLTLQLTCASTMTVVSSGCPIGSSGMFINDGVGDSSVTLNGGNEVTASGFIAGTGSNGFGQKVIAFYDSSNTIQYVLRALPQAVAGKNMYLDGTTTLTGKPCTAGGNIAACIPLNMHITRFDAIMNFVSPGAATNIVSVVGYCPGVMA